MCLAIYVALFALFLYYSHFVITQYALAVPAGNGELMVVALGWEALPLLWPLFIAAMLLSSAATVWVMRRRACPAAA